MSSIENCHFLITALGSVYTKRQRQRCDDASDTALSNTDGLKFLKNNAIQGNSWECIIFVKCQYPEVFNSFKDF